MEIQEKVIEDQKLAVINYKGPISDLDILVSKLMGWVEVNEIETISHPFVIYYSPRHSVNEGDAVYDVGIAISSEDASGEDIIRIVDMFEHKVLSGVHKGDTDNILDSYQEMVDFSVENNYDIIGSPTEVLVRSLYNAEDNEEYITEIRLPVIKM